MTVASVFTVGELLVEIMRPEQDVPLGDVGAFVGPYPSGAPAIFADAVARFGHRSGIVGGVGDDDFGRSVLARLERDGVDVSGVRTSNRATGVAFVAYASDGSRQFIYHMANSAAGVVGPEDVETSIVDSADAVHVNGSSLLMSERMREACLRLVDVAADRGLLVSFDPNVRPELFGSGDDGRETDAQRAAVDSVLERADVLTPTGAELRFLTNDDSSSRSNAVNSSDRSDEATAAAQLLETGADLVAVKKGERGCSLYASDSDTAVHHDGYDVDVVDPTGAGDAFSAAIVVGTLEGSSLETRAAFANAAGARAVTAQGPMEGIAPREAIESFLDRR